MLRNNELDSSVMGHILRMVMIQIMVIISILIMAFYFICFLVILILIENEILSIGDFFSYVSGLILKYSNVSVLITIFLIFYFEYRLYTKVLFWVKHKKNFSSILGGDVELQYVNKYLLTDFTVFIAFLGFIPFLIDSLFPKAGFAEGVKNLVFGYFTFGLVPFVHLIYSNIKK